MIDNKARRRTASILTAFAVVALAIAGCGGTAPESGSVDSTVAGTVHVCSSCHGPDGRSISPTFPRLAGQQKDYIIAQLQAFRDKTRADPHAQTYMWGMAARLSDPTIDAIATYYSSQTPVAGAPSDSPHDDFTLKGICAGIIAVIDFFWDRFLGTYHRVESENIR